MGKNKDKNKEGAPSPTSVTNRDILQRLNFLYQASVLLNGLAPSPYPDDRPTQSSSRNAADEEFANMQKSSQRPREKKKKRRRVVSFGELSRSYVETMKSVGQKTNVKMDPSVKRRICKRCYAPLVPGVSATVRIKDSASHGHLISYQCHGCKAERRIPAPPVLRIGQTSTANDSEDAMETQPTENAPTTRQSPIMPLPTVATSTGNSVRPATQQPRTGKKKRGLQPRLPPHFARDIGHVVFRGNEVVDTTHSIL